MKTEGTQFCFLFHAAKRRGVVARFEGGRISSDAGGLLLREVEKRTEIVKRLAGCFRDHREAGRTEHRVEELVGQRVYALALGYEDLNDHEELRRDPLLALLAGKEDLTGEERVRARRVVAKAEYLAKGPNPRFVVTSLSAESWEARRLYEELYCARGEMENRIKEQQLALFADRTSTGTLRGNQIRLYFSSFAYLLMAALRRLGLKGTELARAQGQTIRLKLLKIGALLRVTARKVWVSIAESYPYAAVFGQVYRNLKAVPLRC